MADEIKEILREARKYVQFAHDEAEARHDEDLDVSDWETMKSTEALLQRIDAAASNIA